MVLRNNLDYRCEIDKQVSKYTSWTYNLNQYLVNLMTTHLYIDLLTPEEKVNRGKAIKKPPVKGLIPLERTKLKMFRHANEGDLLRKIEGNLKGRKNVSFGAGTKKLDAKNPGKSMKKGGGESGEEKGEEAVNEKELDSFPYDMYITKLVEGMNEDEFMEENNAAEWKTYKVVSGDETSSSQSRYKKYTYKSHSSLS